jgi:hypothetical protein
MRIGLDVTFCDGTKQTVEAVFADFILFEKQWNRSVTKFEQELKLTDLAWLAWASMRRQGLTTKSFDPDFVVSIEDISVTDDESGKAPTI